MKTIELEFGDHVFVVFQSRNILCPVLIIRRIGENQVNGIIGDILQPLQAIGVFNGVYFHSLSVHLVEIGIEQLFGRHKRADFIGKNLLFRVF